MFNLLAVLGLIHVVCGQLSASVQQHLKNLANDELKKQLVNGSDNKSGDLQM